MPLGQLKLLQLAKEYLSSCLLVSLHYKHSFSPSICVLHYYYVVLIIHTSSLLINIRERSLIPA